LNTGSITGVIVTKGPDFTTTQGPEYATIRSFTFTAEAEYPLASTSNYLLNYNGTLTFWGGGPIYAHRLAINGPPQKQLIYPASVYHCVQQGSAIGYRAYGDPAAHWLPSAMKEATIITKKGPTRKGNGYQGFEVTWSYDFESAGPLVALPHIWIN